MEMIFDIVKVCLLAYFVVDFPVFGVITQILTDILTTKKKGKIFQFYNYMIDLIINQPLQCYKCSAFWIGLILTGNIFIAIGSSFIMKVYDQKFNSIDL